jgi:hypothetical protein
MDETNSRWFKFIARNAAFIIPFFIGAMTGSFCMVAFSAMTISETGKTAYLTVIASITGATVGWLSTWALAARTDAIKTRRKANLARLALREASATAQALANATGCYATRPAPWGKEWVPLDIEPKWTIETKWSLFDDERVSRIILLMEEIGAATAARPDFDELIDSDADIRHAHSIAIVFRAAARRFAVPARITGGTKEAKRKYVEARFSHASPVKALQLIVNALAIADAHFSRRRE